MTPEGDFSRVELVAHLRSREVLVHDQVRAQLTELLPETELAEAWAGFREIEARTGLTGVLALENATMVPPAEASPPGEPRHPVTRADLELAAWLNTDDILPYDQVRRQLGEVLQRSPLGPAVWRMREIEWAMTVPPTSPRPLQGIAALEAWDEAGELGDELLALADPAAAKDSQYWTALVVHQLLDREREQRFVAPRRGLELAIIGVRVAEETMRRKGNNWRRYRGLVALAQATKANALRILGEAREAARILELAEPFIHGEKDLVVQWEYLSLVGATQSYLRRMGEARQSLDRAIAISRAMNDRHRTARALANRSYLDFAAGVLTSKSLSGLERAAELADPAREPRFRALVYVNLARYQADLGLIAEAEATWRRIPRFQERVLELKRQGVLGVIHLCAERWQSARSVLSATADQLAEIGSADSAYYQLLLVITLLGEGRLSEANRLGLETAALFAGAGIGSIALTAMEVAEEANRGEVSVRAIKQLVMAIEAAPGAVPGAANRSNWSTERIDLGAVPHE